MAHDYPGNVRELENIVEHAFVLCPEGEWIHLRHLPENIAGTFQTIGQSAGIGASLKALEAQAIMSALERNNFNRIATARELGIHKTTLYRKIKSLGIILPEEDGRARQKDEG